MAKKSTAQPRPKLNIPPRGIGPIEEPNENDVLCGRGGRINAHEGNIRFRDIISSNKKVYLAKSTKKLEKAHVAKSIVDDIRSMNPPGRFLKQDASDGFWYDIGDLKAIKKTGQALREDAPDIRSELDQDSSGDEDAQTPPATVPSSASSTDAVADGSGNGAAPTGFVSGHGYANASQRYIPWSAGITPQGYMASVGETAPVHHPYQGTDASASSHMQYHRAHSQPNLGLYGLPAQFYSGIQTQANKAWGVSQRAAEAMRPASSPSSGDMPQQEVAFGRMFTPPVMSSGSTTMSSISSPGASGQRNFTKGRTSGSLRVSQLSEMTVMSLGGSFGLSRSSSLPDLGWSMRESLSEASVAALMGEERVEQVYSATGSDLRESSGSSELKNSSGSSNIRPPGPQARTRTTSHTSALSAMSWASASQRSSSLRSSAGSDSSWLQPHRSQMGEWNDESQSSRYEHSRCQRRVFYIR